MRFRGWFAGLLLLTTQLVHADGHVRLRFATVVPDGTGWAREIHAMQRQVAAETGGTLEIKWYFGGIAGGEMESIARIRRGQLEGTLGSAFCEQLAPSLRAVRLPGLAKTRGELLHVLGLLRPTLASEAEREGFVDIGEAPIGTHYFFTRLPVRDLEQLRRQRLWVWDLFGADRAVLSAIGLSIVPLPIADAAGAFDEGKIDGFVATPTAALAYQWSTRARYVSSVPVNFLEGCLMVSKSAWDELSIPHRQALRTATAEFAIRTESLSFTQDAELLGGLFNRQGLHRVDATASFREELDRAAFQARRQLDARVVPPALIADVVRWLSDYRAQRPARTDLPAAR